MAYSARAREERRCQAVTKAGEPCTCYGVWGDPERRCAAHGGRILGRHVVGKTHAPPCTCVAWPFPHRPGAAPCRWPDPPFHRVLMPPSNTRKTRAYRAEKRMNRTLTREPLGLFFHRLDHMEARTRACWRRVEAKRNAANAAQDGRPGDRNASARRRTLDTVAFLRDTRAGTRNLARSCGGAS
jgi:hypothetical protein